MDEDTGTREAELLQDTTALAEGTTPSVHLGHVRPVLTAISI